MKVAVGWIEEHPEDEMEFGRYLSDLFRREQWLAFEEERRWRWFPRWRASGRGRR